MALLEAGQTIRGTYEVERFLGEGAFAEVYRVRHRFLGRQALKIFKRCGMTIPEIEEMLAEAILLSRIGHPNIIRVFDANAFKIDGTMYGYFTMEYIPGGSLEQFWRSHGTQFVPVETVVDLLRQVCRGVSCAHRESPPIVHRDIKPQNILVGYDQEGLRARVSDFGLAKCVNPLTLIASAAGTLAFKPPEAFGQGGRDSCAADVWALGATMYLLLTDHLPVDLNPLLGWNNVDAFTGEIRHPHAYNVNVDPSLEATVMRCLRKNPEDRFVNAQSLLQALDAWTKPPEPEAAKAALSSSEHKTAIRSQRVSDGEDAQEMARKALHMALQEGQIIEAADLMEEAFNKSPALREQYAGRVQLWRKGISM